MATNFITTTDSLIIKKDDNKKLFFYLLPYIVPAIVCGLLYLMHIFPVWMLLLLLLLSYNFIFIFLKHQPIVFNDITIKKNEHGCSINNKIIDVEKLLFLSIRQKDGYKIIRLEMVRKHILLANEFILFSDVENLEQGIHLCKQIKQFIHPDLKINVIKIGSSSNGSDRNLEKWHFVED
jgi:hypothetical protein